MKTIWKYKLEVTDSQTIEVPKGGKILCVQTQDGIPFLWIEVDSDLPSVPRYFEIFGTGHEIRYDMAVQREYIGTFQMRSGTLVFHVYEYIGI